MPYQITPLGKTVLGTFKWVVVPVLAALVGLKIIGPNLGTPKEVNLLQKPKRQVPAAPESEASKKFQAIREAQH